MKITIEIPKWAERRDIVVMAGIEGLAVKRCDDPYIYVKTDRCNNCGKCCRAPHIAGAFPLDGQGNCIQQIGKSFECGLRVDRPRVCCYSDPVIAKKKDAEDFCSIRYKKIKVR